MKVIVKPQIFIVAFMLLAVILAGCGGGGSVTVPTSGSVPANDVAAVEVSETVAEVKEIVPAKEKVVEKWETTAVPAQAAVEVKESATVGETVVVVEMPAASSTAAPEQAAIEVKESATVGETVVVVEMPMSASTGQTMPMPSPPPSPSGAVPQSSSFGENYRSGQPSDVTFDDYQRSQFVQTVDDSISTFSLDTDRTSYRLALNWAQNGFDIDPASVRAEEWINSFDYDYEQPGSDDEFAITAEVFDHPIRDDSYMARIAFQSPDLFEHSADSQKPLNVTLVLDSSGSMDEGNRVEIARRAAEGIRESLREQDSIAVVQFSGDVIHEMTVQHTSPEDADVIRSILMLTPRQSTNVQAGIDLGVKLAADARRERPDAYNYIVLMSDGVANVDSTSPFAILDSAGDDNQENPLRLIAIGVGINNYNDYLLEQLAQHGNGWYRYLDSVEQADDTFGNGSWLQLSIPFADAARAQVRWNEDVVKAWRIVGYENRIAPDESFGEARKEFAEMPSGSAATVFYELELHIPEGQRPATIESERIDFGEVELRWKTPMTGGDNQQSAPVEFAHNDDEGHILMANFGMMVAMSADRYSALSDDDSEVAGTAHRDLLSLQDELDLLGDSSLSERRSYRDFEFLLRSMVNSASAVSKAAPRDSGYSK